MNVAERFRPASERQVPGCATLRTFARLLLAVLLVTSALAAQDAGTFTNPLLPSGADPWVIQYKGEYFYTQTTGNNLTLWRTRDVTDLSHAQKRVVWTPPVAGPYSHEIWAPELHRFGDKWYLYFAADSGSNESHRIFVLENGSQDPLQGSWTLKGQVADKSNKWAIDASAFELAGQKYLIWSGWQADTNGEQAIYIAHLKNPWTIDSDRHELSHSQYPWESVGDLPNDVRMPHVNVNEGPEVLLHGQDIFLVYSASGCWTDFYSLGVLRAKQTSDLLDPKSWTKQDHPFLSTTPSSQAFGTGHNSFFKSPDGTQDWILYHANDSAGMGCGRHRSPRAQRISWGADGLPDFGKPVPLSEPIARPSHLP